MKSVVCSLGACLMFAGCATIVSSGPDFVPVQSAPEGARVVLDGQPVGRTPMTVSFARKCEGVLAFELDGYERVVVDVDKVVNGWFFGNLVFGGVIGIVVDLAASNQGRYSVAPINVSLARKADE
jgi:hypothetical protein